MAVYDLEEQEQIEALKAWWARFGTLVALAALAGALAFAAVTGWQYWRDKQASEAAQLYDQLLTAADGGDTVKVRDIAAAIADKYPRTGYAKLAQLVAARVGLDAGDTAGAQARLQWLIDHARDDETRDAARLRLSLVLLDQKKYPEALALLETAHAPAWDALYAEHKGDVLTEQGRGAEARIAYQLALEKSEPQSAQRTLVQAKLDALGGQK